MCLVPYHHSRYGETPATPGPTEATRMAAAEHRLPQDDGLDSAPQGIPGSRLTAEQTLIALGASAQFGTRGVCDGWALHASKCALSVECDTV